MTFAQLPPTSPALSVHEAAARIRSLATRTIAEMTKNDYWAAGWALGVMNAIGDVEGELAALFTPELAVQLADWLDERAAANARLGEPIPPLALAITDAAAP